MKKNTSMRIVSSQYRTSYKIRKIITHKTTRYSLALLLVTAAGGIIYSYEAPEASASLPGFTDPAITDADIQSALSDDNYKKLAIESLNTRFAYWNNKPVNKVTIITGTIWMQDESGDRLPDEESHANDPYFFNAPLKSVFEKWSEVKDTTIEPFVVAGAPTYTGYLSELKGNEPGLSDDAELKFVMEKIQ